MRKKYDAVATVGSYRNKAGEEKKRYVTCGAVFEGDDGRLSLKLDAVPASPVWTGWLAFYEPKVGSPFGGGNGGANGSANAGGNGWANGPAHGRPDAHNRAKANAYQPAEDDSDVPF